MRTKGISSAVNEKHMEDSDASSSMLEDEQKSLENQVSESAIFPLFINPDQFQPKNKSECRWEKRTPKRKLEGKEEKPRSRTPSGVELSSSIEDIKQCLNSKSKVDVFSQPKKTL